MHITYHHKRCVFATEVASASDSVDVICVHNNFADATGNSMTDANESAVNSESTFYQWLKKSSLEKHHETFVENGIKEVSHIEDVQEEDAVSLGLSKFEVRRLFRLFAEHKNEQSTKGNEKNIPKTTFKTSSFSVVVFLPKVMKNFVQTRDGMGNVVVKTDSLKSQSKNLYYESRMNPTQVLSNSFILQMAAERMKFSKSLRECELWC